MQLVVDDVAGGAEVDGVDDFVVAVFFVAVEVGSLPAVAAIVEEEGVVGAGVFDEPVHGAEEVGFGGLGHGVLLVVGQDDHVFASVAEVLVEVGGHVLDVVDAAAQLAALAEVVDADEQGFPLACAVGVLEGVVAWSAMTEGLGLLWRGGRAVSLVLIHGWHVRSRSWVAIGLRGRSAIAVAALTRWRRILISVGGYLCRWVLLGVALIVTSLWRIPALRWVAASILLRAVVAGMVVVESSFEGRASSSGEDSLRDVAASRGSLVRGRTTSFRALRAD